jgi:hypothetical protein
MTAQPTAREQFVTDYLLVTDNNETAYNMHMKLAFESNGTIAYMSDKLRADYEKAIGGTLDNIRAMSGHARGGVTVDLMSELLLGWGSDVFDDIARHYIDKDLENRVYDRLSSVLKTEKAGA